MRRVGVCAATAVWQDRLRRLAGKMGVSQPLVLLESSLANGPIVVGLLRPAILFPAGLLSGLPVSQLEAILLHELAHVRRLDYLVNLMQTLIESLLFYHPAVWWVSRLMRDERESCCDDAVVAVRGNVHDYAAALVTLEERQRFIEQFWERRDPTPDTAVNASKVEHYRRIQYADERWTAGVAGWKSDRGRLYVLYGPPDEIESHPSGGTNKRPGFSSSHPFEMWRYRQIDGLGEGVWATFEDKERNGDFPLVLGPVATKPE
jgi:GWxTD domain-containing protein